MSITAHYESQEEARQNLPSLHALAADHAKALRQVQPTAMGDSEDD